MNKQQALEAAVKVKEQYGDGADTIAVHKDGLASRFLTLVKHVAMLEDSYWMVGEMIDDLDVIAKAILKEWKKANPGQKCELKAQDLIHWGLEHGGIHVPKTKAKKSAKKGGQRD